MTSKKPSSLHSSKPSPNSIPPGVEDCFGQLGRLSGDASLKMPTSEGHVCPQPSASQELNQQVTGTSDSQGDLPHEDIVNPQEESTPLYWLSIDIGSIGAFQVVEPYLLLHVHDRTMSPANAWELTSKIVAIPASDAEDWRCLPCILPIHFSDHAKRRIGFVQSVILLVRTRLPKPIRQLLNNGASQTDGIFRTTPHGYASTTQQSCLSSRADAGWASRLLQSETKKSLVSHG